MYLRIINGIISYPYSLQKLREDNPHTSFPSEMTESLIREWDIYEVRTTPKPNDYTKNILEGTPILLEDIYYQNWTQTNASQSEIDLRILDKWDEVRQQRNELLKECDWTQLSDITEEIKNYWATYRQQLRDITTQSNPYYITWPVKP